MTVYKYFLKAAARQKWVIIGYTAIFFLLAILNGASTETNNIAFMEKNLEIAIVDRSQDELSKGLVDCLGTNNTLIGIEDNIEVIKEQIFLESLNAVIIIPEDFKERVENKEPAIEIVKDDRKMGPLQVENDVNKFLVFANASIKEGTYNLEEIKDLLAKEVEVEMLSLNKSVKNKGADTWFRNYFNFTGYIIIAIYVTVIGFVMVEFNDKNKQDRMKISAKKFLSLNTEIYLGQVTIGLMITFILVISSLVLKGKHLGEIDFLKYLVNIFVFSSSILCFTFLINNITRSKFVINGISTVASLGTAFISGVLVPQEFLGENVLRLARFFPTYYFVRINNSNISSFLDVRYELAMQVLFAISFFLMGLYFSKIKQKS